MLWKQVTPFKQIAEPVEHVNKKLRALIDDMAETMYETDGVGLAAPQVAVSKTNYRR